MKFIATILLTSAMLFCSGIALASCCNNDEWDNRYGYQDKPSCDCQCTDPNRFHNDCMSNARYCQAFGNVGDMAAY